MHEPYQYISGLSIDDLEDLQCDIKVYNELEKGANSSYWEDLTVIVDDDLKKLKKQEMERNSREGIHQSVAKEVSDIFRGKSTKQLNELKTKIEHKIGNQTDGLDVGYWESLLSQLKAHMARARLRDRHQENLKMKLELLKREQEESFFKKEETVVDENGSISDHANSPEPGSSKDPMPSTSKSAETDDSSQDSSHHSVDKNHDVETDLLEECFKLYERGSYSPKYLKTLDIEPGIDILTEEENQLRLEEMRNKVIDAENEEEALTKQDMLLRQEARKGMNDDEAEFSVETKLDSQIYLWSDKYRPRKPRYFNRVHTGFEWNKYNQTHYDMDNVSFKFLAICAEICSFLY